MLLSQKCAGFQNYPKMKLGMLSHSLFHYFIIGNLSKNVLQLDWYNFLFCGISSATGQIYTLDFFFLVQNIWILSLIFLKITGKYPDYSINCNSSHFRLVLHFST